MNADRMREFFERAGYRVATTASADWYVPGNRVYKNFPCGRVVLPAAEEIAGLCRHPGIVGVEFYNTRDIGVPSGLWVVRDPAYGLHSLQRQFRQRLLRALDDESVREIGFDELFRLGVPATLESLARLRYEDRHLSDPANWRRLCDAGAGSPGAGAFASFSSRGLTAYLIHFTVGATCYGLVSKSLDTARHSGANHALYFTYTQTMSRRPGIDAITMGVRGAPPLEGVDRMKRHAGYHLEPFSVAVFLRPAARALLMGAAGNVALTVGSRLVRHSGTLQRAQALRDMVHATDKAYARETGNGAPA